MGPASKTSRNTSSRSIGEVDAVARLEPKKMVKEEMTGGNRGQGRKKNVESSMLFREYCIHCQDIWVGLIESMGYYLFMY